MAGNALIKHRGDTAANWTTGNPVLAAREIGLETDTAKFKVGDGTTAWASLSYWGSSAWGGITGTLSDQTDLQAALDAKADALGAPGAPTIALGAAAGAGSYTIDAYGDGWATVSVTTGASVSSGAVLTLTYPSAFTTASAASFEVASVSGAAAAGVRRSGYISAQSASDFTLSVNGATILSAATVYKLNFFWRGA